MKRSDNNLSNLETVSEILTDISEKFLGYFAKLESAQEKKEDTFPLHLQDHLENIEDIIKDLSNQITSFHDKATQTPSSPFTARKVLGIIVGVSMASSLITGLIISFLFNYNRYELGDRTIETYARGKALERAWPHLSAHEKKKIASS